MSTHFDKMQMEEAVEEPKLTPVSPDGRRRLAGRIFVALVQGYATTVEGLGNTEDLLAEAYALADAFIAYKPPKG